jgi:hypothetical protein
MPNYEDYLEHFFTDAEAAIREGKGQELSDNLSHIAELIGELINREVDSPTRFRSNYAFCRRRYIQLYDDVLENGAGEDLRSSIFNSISVNVRYSRQSNDLEAFDQLLNALVSCYVRSYPDPGFDEALEDFFERLDVNQRGIVQNFEKVDSADRLAKSSNIIDTFLGYYREVWRYAVEYECRESAIWLHENLEEVRGFEQARYLPLGRPENQYSEEFLEEKQEVADAVRKRIQIQKFAAYSWAYNLYVKDVLSEDFLKDLFQDHAEEEFSTVKSLTETYFDIRAVLEGLPYWDDWEMERQLEESRGGPVMTSMGSNSWIPSFYLAFSLYLFDEGEQEVFLDSAPEELPFPTTEDDRLDLDSLLDSIEEFEDDYPLEFLLDGQTDIGERIEALSEVLDRAFSHAEKQAIMRVRNHSIDPDYVDSWEQEMNDQFDSSCQLRRALKEVGVLKQKRFPPDLDGVKVSVGYPQKRSFVPEDQVNKPVTTNFRRVLEGYREYVLRRLTLEERTVESIEELIDEMEGEVKKRNPSIVLLQTGEHRRQFLEDEKFERGSDMDDAHFSFMDRPVLTEATDHYTALLLLESESHGVEYIEDGRVLTVTATQGEETDVFDMPNQPLESVPYTNAPHDFVQLEVRLRGFIDSRGLDGVVFRMSSDSPS